MTDAERLMWWLHQHGGLRRPEILDRLRISDGTFDRLKIEMLEDGHLVRAEMAYAVVNGRYWVGTERDLPAYVLKAHRSHRFGFAATFLKRGALQLKAIDVATPTTSIPAERLLTMAAGHIAEEVKELATVYHDSTIAEIHRMLNGSDLS